MRAMATSDTGSSFDQWSLGMYGYEGLPLGHADGGGVATTDSTIVTTSAAVTSPASTGSGDGSPGGSRRGTVGIQGPRVGKTAAAVGRKRSRASRRAPVTLLNTDAANFRAMVQQFTGIPAPSPFSGAPGGGGGGVPVISFAGDYGFPPPAGVMSSFDHAHQRGHPSTFQDHQQLLRPHHQQHQYTGAGPFGYSSLHGLAGDGFGGSAEEEEDKMLLQSIQKAAQTMPFAASTANHDCNGYFA